MVRGPDEAQCRDCGAPIMWRETVNGKRMPLDPGSDPAGRVRLVGGKAEVLGRADAAERQAAGELLFRPHVVSCIANRRAGVGMPDEHRERIRRRNDPVERIRVDLAKRGSRRRHLGRRDG